MTKKHALQILLDAALQQCAGSGVGLRHVPSDNEKAKVVAAARYLWRDAYEFGLTPGTLDNYGLARFLDPDNAHV